MRHIIPLILLACVGCAGFDKNKLPTDGSYAGEGMSGAWAHSVSAKYDGQEAIKLIDASALKPEAVRAFLVSIVHEMEVLQDCLTESYVQIKAANHQCALLKEDRDRWYNCIGAKIERWVIGSLIGISIAAVILVIVKIFVPGGLLISKLANFVTGFLPGHVSNGLDAAESRWAARKDGGRLTPRKSQ